jgi:hypothetical protein
MIKYDKTIFLPYNRCSYIYKQARGSFIFSLRNKENLPPFKAPLKNQNDGHAVYAGLICGPAFEEDFGLYISYNADLNIYSYTNFGHSYQPPSGDNDHDTILAGTCKFSPSDVGVFYLV